MAEAADTQAIVTASLRRWLQRLAVVGTAVLLLAGLLPAFPDILATSAAAATGDTMAKVTVHQVTPSVPTANDTLVLRGSVTNNGDATISDALLGVLSGPALHGRGAIDRSIEREGFTYGEEGWPVSEKYALSLTDLPPGASREYTLRVPMKALALGEPGTYQVGVSLTGQTKKQPWKQVLGIERTVLPWQPSPSKAKTRMAFLWPLISSAHLTARTEADAEQTPVFHNDDLRKELAPGGRLQQLVALGKDLPVTWVVDPDLLATADAMTKPYQVATEDGRTVPGKGQQDARRWLHALQEAVQEAEVVALPYGDPDLASLAHRGKNVTGSLRHLGPATELAELTVETILGTKPTMDFAWPAEGAIDRSIVSVATSAGAHHVVARSDSLRERRSLAYTPSAARPIGGGTTAVVADARLSTLFEGDLTRAANASHVTQRFLAQTQSITAQVPEIQRTIVVAPQRRPTASQAHTMAETLNMLRDQASWIQFADLTEAASAEPDPSANRQVPGASSYPKELRSEELPTTAFEQMRETQGTLDSFTVILTRADRVVAPVGNAIRRELSTSWRGTPDQAAAYRGSVQSYLVGLTRKVRLVQKSPITLSGRSATIPVTVENNLFQAVEGLRLELKSSRRLGLEVGDPQPVRVAGGHLQSVKFSTTAKANGRANLEAQLYTPDGKPFGAPMTFQANVTEITSTVLLVIAGGVLLVVLAGIRMYTQRKRAASASDPQGSDSADPSDADDDANRNGDGGVPDDGDDDPGDGGGPEGPSNGSGDAGGPGGTHPGGAATDDRPGDRGAEEPEAGDGSTAPMDDGGAGDEATPENSRGGGDGQVSGTRVCEPAPRSQQKNDESDETGRDSGVPSAPGETVDR